MPPWRPTDRLTESVEVTQLRESAAQLRRGLRFEESICLKVETNVHLLLYDNIRQRVLHRHHKAIGTIIPRRGHVPVTGLDCRHDLIDGVVQIDVARHGHAEPAMSDQAAEYAVNFAWSLIANQMRSTYQEVINSPK